MGKFVARLKWIPILNAEVQLKYAICFLLLGQPKSNQLSLIEGMLSDLVTAMGQCTLVARRLALYWHRRSHTGTKKDQLKKGRYVMSALLGVLMCFSYYVV